MVTICGSHTRSDGSADDRPVLVAVACANKLSIQLAQHQPDHIPDCNAHGHADNAAVSIAHNGAHGKPD